MAPTISDGTMREQIAVLAAFLKNAPEKFSDLDQLVSFQ